MFGFFKSRLHGFHEVGRPRNHVRAAAASLSLENDRPRDHAARSRPLPAHAVEERRRRHRRHRLRRRRLALQPHADHRGRSRSPTIRASTACRSWSPAAAWCLQTPAGEIDVRRPFRPVRFAGETPIVSRLEAGPVEVINLMGERSRVRLDLAVLEAGQQQRLGPGMHIAYCPGGQARLGSPTRLMTLGRSAASGSRTNDGVATCERGRIVRLGSVR